MLILLIPISLIYLYYKYSKNKFISDKSQFYSLIKGKFYKKIICIYT